MALDYSQKVMDHFINPRNVGEIENADGVGEAGNPKCGDIMKIYLKVNPDTKIIDDVKFKTFGCASAIASSSMATEMIKGRNIRTAAHQDALLGAGGRGDTYGIERLPGQAWDGNYSDGAPRRRLMFSLL